MDKERKQIAPPSVTSEAKDKLLKKMYISNVINRLMELNSPKDTDRKRWIWELIQNAKDTISNSPDRDSVDIKINIDGDVVKFSHNGAPFTPDARFALLWKYSEDKENQESTGRFGTGFLTTHCLSKIVSIESDMYMEGNKTCGFSVTMYRDGQVGKELLEGLEKMEKSEVYYEVPFGWTTYTYHVNTDSGRRAIELGIKNFHENIAQTMMFCKELRFVELNNNGKITILKRLPMESVGNGISLAKFEINENGHIHERRFLVTSYSEHDVELSKKYKTNRNIRIDAAIEIDCENNIVDHKGKTSFYCALPLVGIENQLNEPLIINSPDFEPDSERQSLRLNGEDWNEEAGVISEVGINHKIYCKCFPLYEKMLDYLSINRYGKLYLLANGLKNPMDHKELDAKWYMENVIKKYREIFSKFHVVKSYGDSDYKRLEECIIAKEAKEEDEQQLFSLLSSLYPAKLAEENHAWAQYAWKDGARIWGTEELCKDIEKKGNWKDVAIEGTEIHTWYNQFLQCVVKFNELLLKEYALLPNMNGEFLKRDAKDFRQGENVTTFVIELLEKLGKDIKPILLHDAITAVTLEAKYNSQSFSADANRLAKEIIDDGRHEKLHRLLPLLQVVPNDAAKYPDGFLQKRDGFLSIATSLYPLQNVSKFCDNSLLEGAWKDVDAWFVTTVLSTLDKSETLSNLPTGLDCKWLNEALRTLDVDPKRLNNYAVLPNQHGNFCKQNALYVDSAIPEELKDEVFGQISLDYKDILLHKDMDAETFAINQKKDVSDFASELNNNLAPKNASIYGASYFNGKCYKYSQDAIESVSLYLLDLLPKDEDSDIGKTQHSIQTATCAILGKADMPNVSYIDYGGNALWKESNNIIAFMLSRKIAEYENLDNLRTHIGEVGEVETFDALNRFYRFLRSSNFNYDALPIFPNQNGTFRCLKELKKEEGSIPEIIKDIISHLVSEEEQYRYILADKRSFIQPEQTTDSLAAFKLIDDKVDELYRDSANYDNPDYIKAVHLLLEDWAKECKGQLNGDYFPKTFPKKDSIILNVVWKEEKRSMFLKIGQEYNDEQLEYLIKNSEEVKNMQAKVDELEKKVAEMKKQLELPEKEATPQEAEEEDSVIKTMSEDQRQLLEKFRPRPQVELTVTQKDGSAREIIVRELQYSGLSKEEVVYYVTEAKMQVVNYYRRLKEEQHQDYRIDEKLIALDSFSQLYGIFGPDGKEIPLVVHSYLGPEYRDFSLNWYDYQLLAKPGSMLWVLTKTDGLQCIPQYALPVNHLTLEAQDNGKQAVARTLATVAAGYGVNVSFSFGNNMPCGFKEPKSFYEVPNELEKCIDSIKQVCQKEVPTIAKFYNCKPPLQRVYISDEEYAACIKKEDTTMKELFGLEAQSATEPITADSNALID